MGAPYPTATVLMHPCQGGSGHDRYRDQLGGDKIIVKSMTYAIKSAHQLKLGDWASDLGQNGIRGSGGKRVWFML